MSRQLNLGRGSKRTVKSIRWQPLELTSLFVVVVILLIATIVAGLWVGAHHID